MDYLVKGAETYTVTASPYARFLYPAGLYSTALARPSARIRGANDT